MRDPAQAEATSDSAVDANRAFPLGAVELHARGVELVDEGDYASAVESFARAGGTPGSD